MAKKDDPNPEKITPPHQIADLLQDINLGGLDGSGKSGGQEIKGSTSLYNGTDGLRANRSGYVTLGAVFYTTQTPNCIFYLPLPDNFYAPLDLIWSENNEEDFFSEFMTKMGQAGGMGEAGAKGTVDITAMAGARKGLAKLRELGGQGVDAFLRSQGLAYNPNKQLYFEGVSLSSAQWSFNLIPKNKREAEIMYASAKYMMFLSTPGAAGEDALALLGEIGKAAKGLFTQEKQSSEQQKQDSLKLDDEQIKKMEALAKNQNFIGSGQPAFFQYPNLWDFTVYYPMASGKTRKVFEWKRLAITSFRINFGSEQKWHPDGYPLSISLEIGVQETVVRTRASMSKTMPVVVM